MDEADRILNMDFEAELDKILKVIPKERHTYLYSATMTKKVNFPFFIRFTAKDQLKTKINIIVLLL